MKKLSANANGSGRKRGRAQGNARSRPAKGAMVRTEAVRPPNPHPQDSRFRASDFLANASVGGVVVTRDKGATVFSQGDMADSVFYIQHGKIKLGVVSKQGKEAIVAVLSAGEFAGEDCIASAHPVRLVTATALTDCKLLRIDKREMVRELNRDAAFSDVFVSFLLARNARIQEDLIDQLFNSSEKRLARVLLLLAQFGKEGKAETVVPKLSQESLAEMVGTTRSRVSFFMNRFRKLGFIEYNGEIRVHSSLLNVVLHD
jgi:CRP/FNR family transcriptional regulator, cyclic AMP receptor protein